MDHQATTQPDELGLFTPREAAERLKCSVNHVYRLIARAQLRAVDIAHAGARRPKTRIRPDDLKAYIDSRAGRRIVTSEPGSEVPLDVARWLVPGGTVRTNELDESREKPP